jgi:hypothetical protein
MFLVGYINVLGIIWVKHEKYQQSILIQSKLNRQKTRTPNNVAIQSNFMNFTDSYSNNKCAVSY